MRAFRQKRSWAAIDAIEQYAIIRYLMHEAAVQAGIDPDRLSFVHAVELIKEAIPEFQMVVEDQREQLYLAKE